SGLLINVFVPNTPLHDGAMIIQGDKIITAGSYLPLSESNKIGKDLGTRHRAAVGISEVTDAFTVVISEETGDISTTVDSKLNKIFEDFNLFGKNSGKDNVTIENVPVNVKYDEDNLFVSGAQESVQVNLSGPPSKIKQLQTTQDFTVELDLTNYELGEYEVD